MLESRRSPLDEGGTHKLLKKPRWKRRGFLFIVSGRHSVIANHMKTTRYFEEEVMAKKRPYMKREWCLQAISSPDYKMLQSDGRIRYYKYIIEVQKFVRVITLEDGETIHNIFFDRRFRPQEH